MRRLNAQPWVADAVRAGTVTVFELDPFPLRPLELLGPPPPPPPPPEPEPPRVPYLATLNNGKKVHYVVPDKYRGPGLCDQAMCLFVEGQGSGWHRVVPSTDDLRESVTCVTCRRALDGHPPLG